MKNLVEADPNLATRLKQYCFDLNGCLQEVHSGMGPFLNEYMYQDALEIVLKERNIPYVREHYFSVEFHGQRISHKHYVDFFCKDQVYIECKAIESLGVEQRQQLWNYMRLSRVKIGILYNFAPLRDQSEHYYLDVATDQMYYF